MEIKIIPRTLLQSVGNTPTKQKPNHIVPTESPEQTLQAGKEQGGRVTQGRAGPQVIYFLGFGIVTANDHHRGALVGAFSTALANSSKTKLRQWHTTACFI